MTKTDFDIYLANFYRNKQVSAKARGIAFDLTLTQVKNMLRAKRCQLSGIALTHSFGDQQKATDVTIDRLDSSKGYVTGNVAAVAYCVNQVKSAFENPQRRMSVGVLHTMSKNLKKKGIV